MHGRLRVAAQVASVSAQLSERIGSQRLGALTAD